MVPEENAARLRQRAEKLRAIAAAEDNRQNRELLKQVAREYDDMAREAELLAKQSV
jgi:hypothetical protein